MSKYASVNEPTISNKSIGRNRGNYNSFDYRDVTLVKHNGMESIQSEKYKPNINYGKNNQIYFNPCNRNFLFLIDDIGYKNISNEEDNENTRSETYNNEYNRILLQSKRERKDRLYPLMKSQNLAKIESIPNSQAVLDLIKINRNSINKSIAPSKGILYNINTDRSRSLGNEVFVLICIELQNKTAPEYQINSNDLNLQDKLDASKSINTKTYHERAMRQKALPVISQ